MGTLDFFNIPFLAVQEPVLQQRNVHRLRGGLDRALGHSMLRTGEEGRGEPAQEGGGTNDGGVTAGLPQVQYPTD